MKLTSITLFLTLILLCGVLPSMASTRTVTSLADDGSAATLRAAINGAAPGDVVTFGVNGTITLGLGTIEINKNLTISGVSASKTIINGNHLSTVLQIDSGVSVSIVGVTVEDGNACSSFSCNGNGGGGIRNGGALSLTNVVISGNSTGCNCNAGGGILNTGALTVSQSTFSGNGAAYGGAIGNYGTLTVINSTFSGNGAADGGGVFNGGTGAVSFSTFYNNGSNFGAPGIDGGSSLTVKGVLFGNNNFVDGVGNPYAPGSCTAVVSAGYNLADDSSCSSALTQSTDLNNTPAGLDSSGLKDNGGPTQTVSLMTGSQAIDVVPTSSTNYCTDTAGISLVSDQRGMARPQGVACEIGAFEVVASDDDSAFAHLVGGNNLSGNQNVNGTVSASAFVGDGSGLSGIRAQSSVTADSANFATTAGDAATLGGYSANTFAPASGSPNYVSKSGDSMTGTLTLPANGLLAGSSQLSLFGGNVGIGTATPEAVSGYTSLHIDNGGTGFGGAFLQLTHSTTSNKARIVSDANGLLMCSGCGGGGAVAAPVRIKAGEITTGTDSHIFILPNGNVGVGTVTPAAKLDVNGTANFSGLVTFASGQTFPGGGNGTITGVTPGAGLSGGGSSGNVTLANTGVLSLGVGSGINSSGGQNPVVSLSTSFTDARYLQLGGGTITGNLVAGGFNGNGSGLTNLNPASLSSGTAAINITGLAAAATNALALGGNPPGAYATTGANTFTGTQNVTSDMNVTGSVTAANVSVTGPFVSGLSSGLATTGMRITATGGATSSQGFPSNPVEFWASSFNSSTGNRWNQIFQWVAEPKGNNTPNASATLNLRFIAANLPPPPSGFTLQETGLSIGAHGELAIGSGTPIIKHISAVFPNVVFNTKLSPTTCTVWSGAVSSAADGDTVAAGLASSLMAANIVYAAWATNGTVVVRICNPTGVPTTVSSGNIRIDVWKH